MTDSGAAKGYVPHTAEKLSFAAVTTFVIEFTISERQLVIRE